jgi:hypothetical protein
VAVVPYDDLLADPDSDEGRAQRPDGTHLEEKFGEELARESLIPRLREVYASTIDAMITAGCLDANGQPFDAASCRISR